MYECEFYIKDKNDETSLDMLCSAEIPYIPSVGEKFYLADIMEGMFRVKSVQKELWIGEKGQRSDFLICIIGEIVEDFEETTFEEVN